MTPLKFHTLLDVHMEMETMMKTGEGTRGKGAGGQGFIDEIPGW